METTTQVVVPQHLTLEQVMTEFTSRDQLLNYAVLHGIKGSLLSMRASSCIVARVLSHRLGGQVYVGGMDRPVVCAFLGPQLDQPAWMMTLVRDFDEGNMPDFYTA